MVSAFSPIDSPSRELIVERLDQTLFVEASAGTGKTHSLVSRIIRLVSSGTATLDKIAAITFTEAAASELRDRIRQELERRASNEGSDPQERKNCERGLVHIDQAAIQTLHSFAALLLRERPLEAGLPPAFEVSDEIQAGIKFNEEWDRWLDWALDQPDLARHIARGGALGLDLTRIKSIAQDFHRSYDDLAGASFGPDSLPPSTSSALLQAVPLLERLCDFSHKGAEDKLYSHVQDKLAAIQRLEGVEPGSNLSFRMLKRLLPLKCRLGSQGDWDADPVTGDNACKSLKELLQSLHALVSDELQEARRSTLAAILQALRRFALDYVQKRRAEGRAEFHDFLVWARDLLRDNIQVRDYFRNRFSHLLVDEVQDTDPLQAEIALFLSEAVPSGIPTSHRPTSWLDITPEKGKLFVVGDPKQSIYRFRRADILQMNSLRKKIESAGGESVSLTQNFRSHRPIVSWVNGLFSSWMHGGDAQAAYEEMHHRWEADSAHPHRPRVWALADAEHEAKMDEIRRHESRDIAMLLHQMVAEEWLVRDRQSPDNPDVSAYRPARYSDICILMPTRTGLSTLERTLEDLDVPFRLENASLIFETQEVRDLLNCLRAIDDPSNAVAVVGALRSPAFGCSDVELFQHIDARGSFDYTTRKVSPDTPVSRALEVLLSFHVDKTRYSPAALIDRVIRDRCLVEAALDHPRYREQWRRYAFIIELAWRFTEGGGSGLREFVQGIEDQAKDRVRVTETPVPDPDEDAVRVMTIHAAKGLEFPVVVLTGINSRERSSSESVIFDRVNGEVEVGVGPENNRISTPGYEDLAAFEKKMSDAERERLLYVAATRACDHLVLSLRRPKKGSNLAGKISEAMQGSNLWEPVELSDLDEIKRPASTPQSPPALVDHSVEARDRWESQRSALIEELSRPSFVAATELSRPRNGPQDKPEPDTEEPWRRGRAGTSIGRAVHAVLQSIDLSTGAGIQARSRAQAAAEGIPDRQEEIARHVAVALSSDIVKRAVASGRLWREVPVSVPTGDGALHGFIDLLFEENDALVIVDYKTDALSPEETADASLRYRMQGGAYAYAIPQITSKPVKEVVFLYLHPKSEEPLLDLETAIEDARAQAEAILGISS